MSNFIRGANPIWYFVDLVGIQLDDRYYISFLQNTIPYLPQSIFQDPDGTIPWQNPIPFYLNGTLPDNMYFNEDLVYRLEIRKGPLQSDPLIYMINNYMVGTGGGMTPTNTDILTANNQITNPQFSVVNFGVPPSGTQPVLTISTAGTYNIAPGWQLVLTGTGSVTLTQLILSGSQNFIDNPNYALQVNSNGFSSVQLIQQFNNNGALWSLGAVGMSILVKAVTNPAMVTLFYQPSTGAATQIAQGIIPITGFAPFGGFTNLNNPAPTPISPGNASTNTDLSTVAYVQAVINLPSNGEVQISNVQLMGQDAPLPSNFNTSAIPDYQQQTNEREIDHTFHYYNPQLRYKPIPSYLVGWDFPLNPAQFGSTVGPITAGFIDNSFYSWDQTIVFQSVDASVTASRGNGGELYLTTGANTQIAIIQYLPLYKAREILNNAISVNVAAVANGQTIGCTISLWYTSNVSLPSTIASNLSLVSSLDANGHPSSVVAGWNEVPRINGQNAFFTVQQLLTTNFFDYNFNGWNLNGVAGVNTANFFAIVIGTAQITSGNQIRFGSVGLMNGMIATRPAPQSPDEVLRECQYYYEQSYNPGVIPGTVTNTGIRFADCPLSAQVQSGFISFFKNTFEVQFLQVKQASPVMTFISAAGTAANVSMGVYDGNPFGHYTYGLVDVGISNWTALQTSDHNIIYQPNNNTVIHDFGAENQGSQMGIIFYHYVADSRLGQ